MGASGVGPFLGILARSPPGAEGKPPEQGSQAAGDVAPSGRVGGHLVCRQAPVCSLGSLGTRAGPGPPPRLPRGGHEDGPLSSVPPRPWMAFGLTAGRVCSAKSWPFGSLSECQHFEPGRPLALLCSFLGSEVVRPRGRADTHLWPGSLCTQRCLPAVPGPWRTRVTLVPCPFQGHSASHSIRMSCLGEGLTVRDRALPSGPAGPGRVPAHAMGLRLGQSGWTLLSGEQGPPNSRPPRTSRRGIVLFGTWVFADMTC